MLRELVQEVRELGWRGTAFRTGWEVKKRTGAFEHLAATPAALNPAIAGGDWTRRLPFADPIAVVEALRDRIPPSNLANLGSVAASATQGRIFCFGRWDADFGNPIDWHLNPVNGQRWNPSASWAHALRDEARVGDVKFTWEIGRFPHAFDIARAAAFSPEASSTMAAALVDQFQNFTRENPYGQGVHWASGQEVSIRLISWVFALDVLLSRSSCGPQASELVANALQSGATHIVQHLDYAQVAVYNNHLLSEALGLYVAGILLGNRQWRETGRRILGEESHRQFYADGAYIQQSHNYHRVALHTLLCAGLFAKASGEAPDNGWLSAMDRSLSLLLEHQNPSDGRLPNYGSNDGAQPFVLSTCDFSDFRPVLQAACVAVRGKRLYEPGPWDETAAWYFGPGALDLPLDKPRRKSTSFAQTGYHVMRGNDEGSFATFRCGSIPDRFSQIDMLHLDVWWRGLNLFVDAGSYLYNGPSHWHEHFLQTASHNTLVLDGRDQMLHHRRFKNLYWTKAQLLNFEVQADHVVCSGEHSGYARQPGGCVHRRSVLFIKDDLWIVADQVRGNGSHQVRLQWLAGQPEYQYSPAEGRLSLDTVHGQFSLTVFDDLARPVSGTVVVGSEDPPRGWLSRYYGEREPVASLVVEQTARMPVTLITVLGAGEPLLSLEGGIFKVSQAEKTAHFQIADGILSLGKDRAR